MEGAGRVAGGEDGHVAACRGHGRRNWRRGGERPAAVFFKLERTAKAAEDELEHTVPCLLVWLHWELEGKGRRRSARLIEERSRLELAAAEDSTAAISAGIGAGLRRCSIKWT